MAKWTLHVVRFVDADMVARVLEVEHRTGETLPVTVAGIRTICPGPEHWQVGELVTLSGFYDFTPHLRVGDSLTVTTEEPSQLEVTHVGA